MRSVKSALGLAVIGLVSLAAPTSASWTTPQQVATGNLFHPSMVADSHGAEHIVARGESGIWYVTNKSGSWARTRITHDFDTTAGGDTVHHVAISPLISIDAAGRLTVVYALDAAVDGGSGGCGAGSDTSMIRYVVRQGAAWSSPKIIAGTECQQATGIVTHGSTISLATLRRTNSDATSVAFVTNVSGSWTHVTVASGLGTGTAISPASLATYDGKPMLAFIKNGRVVYSRGQTKTGHFTSETAAHTDADELVEPSLAIQDEQPMIAWAQGDGTHYAYRNAYGWYAERVMPGRTRALLVFDSAGTPFIAAADYYGGLWLGTRTSGGTWSSRKLDAHLVSDLAGIGASGGSAMMFIAYARGEGTTHLFSVSDVSSC